MKLQAAVLLCAIAIAAPVCSFAATVDASMVPDGTYVVKVQKVEDPSHMTVQMNNGVETTLTAKGSASFAQVKPNDTVKVSIVSGKVPVLSHAK